MAREGIASVMGVFVQPVDMLADYASEAIESDEPDFEDALVRICAEREGASVIISRDERAFGNSCIPRLASDEYLVREGFDYTLVEW